MVSLPFADRLEAGRLLADELSLRGMTDEAVILALSRGGVPVGFAVADRLHLPLDVIVARKLGVPWQPELAMGAIAGAERVLDSGMIRELRIGDEDLEEVAEREQAEMRRRENLYRAGEPALGLKGLTAILIDDGLATGNTMRAAIHHVRRFKPSKVIVGVPVGSRAACDLLRDEADELVCLATPDLFFAVGEWYTDFRQVRDSEVQKLLTEARRRLKEHLASQAA